MLSLAGDTIGGVLFTGSAIVLAGAALVIDHDEQQSGLWYRMGGLGAIGPAAWDWGARSKRSQRVSRCREAESKDRRWLVGHGAWRRATGLADDCRPLVNQVLSEPAPHRRAPLRCLLPASRKESVPWPEPQKLDGNDLTGGGGAAVSFPRAIVVRRSERERAAGWWQSL